jgi:hypothetical protein
MANKIEEAKNPKDDSGDIFNTCIESYMEISKIWEESYIRLYEPWLKSTSVLLEKAIEASTTNSPEKYREFYDEWTKTFQGRLERINQVPNLETNKKALEKLLINAEKSTDICKSWATELEKNSRKTREILKETPDPIKYKETYDLWIKSYAKIFDGLLTLPFRENVRDMFENYTGMPDIYSDVFVKISKLWNDSYIKLYETWADALIDLSKKSEEISKGNAGPDAYKEFYFSWINIYQQTYGKLVNIQSTQDQKEREEQLKTALENFAQNTTICTNLCKSWISALNKLSERSMELSLSKQVPHAHDIQKEICSLWVRVYQKAFNCIFDNMQIATPFKDMLIPAKDAAKMYVDTLAKASDMWMQPIGRANRV